MLINKIKKIKIFLIILFFTFFSIFLLSITDNDEDLAENTIKPFIVKTKKITLTDIYPEHIFYGNIKAQSEIDVIAKLSGKITKVSSKVITNQYFEKDEIIFELDPFNFKQEFIKKKSKLVDLENELETMSLILDQVKQQQELSKKNYERKKRLVGDIVTKKNLDDAETNLSLSTAKVLELESNVQT